MHSTRCPGPISRRDVLKLGALSLSGFRVPSFLSAEGIAKKNPDTAVILFWMWGGPSQFETFDPKPAAPSEYRGPFKPIRTSVPGLDVCELLPLHAKAARRFSLVRSL